MPKNYFIRYYQRNLHRLYAFFYSQKYLFIKGRNTILVALVIVVVFLLLSQLVKGETCSPDGTTCTITYLSKNNDFDDNGGLSPGQCHNFTDEQGWFHKECLNTGTNFDIYMSKTYSFKKGKKYPKLYQYYGEGDANDFQFHDSTCSNALTCTDPPLPKPTPTPPPPPPPPPIATPKTYRYSMIEKLRRRPFQIFNSAECIFAVIEIDDKGNQKFIKGDTNGLQTSDYANVLKGAQQFPSLTVDEVSKLPTDYDNPVTKDALFWKAQYIAPNCRNWKPYYHKI